MFPVHGFCLICQKSQESQTWIFAKITTSELTIWGVATQGWPLSVAAVLTYPPGVHANSSGGCCIDCCHLPCLHGPIPSPDGSRWPSQKWPLGVHIKGCLNLRTAAHSLRDLVHLSGVPTKSTDPSRTFLVHGFGLICPKIQESQTWILPKSYPQSSLYGVLPRKDGH